MATGTERASCKERRRHEYPSSMSALHTRISDDRYAQYYIVFVINIAKLKPNQYSYIFSLKPRPSTLRFNTQQHCQERETSTMGQNRWHEIRMDCSETWQKEENLYYTLAMKVRNPHLKPGCLYRENVISRRSIGSVYTFHSAYGDGKHSTWTWAAHRWYRWRSSCCTTSAVNSTGLMIELAVFDAVYRSPWIIGRNGVQCNLERSIKNLCFWRSCDQIWHLRKQEQLDNSWCYLSTHRKDFLS